MEMDERMPYEQVTNRASGAVYRDDGDGVRQALAREHGRCDQAIAALQETLAPVYAARVGRAAAGAVLLAGAVVLVAGAVLLREHDAPGLITAMLLAPWPAALVAGRVARALARRSFARRMRAPLAPTGDAHMDLARARRLDTGRHAAGLIAPLERWSVALPLAGVALLLPLSVHFVVWLLLMGDVNVTSQASLLRALGRFDEWILLSMAIVGHCHLVLAITGWCYGWRLATISDQDLDQAPYQAGWRAYGFTTMASVVPGALLIFLPVILVAVTGLLVPPLYARTNARVLHERAALYQATQATGPARQA